MVIFFSTFVFTNLKIQKIKTENQEKNADRIFFFRGFIKKISSTCEWCQIQLFGKPPNFGKVSENFFKKKVVDQKEFSEKRIAAGSPFFSRFHKKISSTCEWCQIQLFGKPLNFGKVSENFF